MKIVFTGIGLFITVFMGVPVHAAQEAILPAYALVSVLESSMTEYKDLIDKQDRTAAKKLLRSRKVFISPKDIKVEVVSSNDTIAMVRLERLDNNAEPVALYFWTLADQLKFLPQDAKGSSSR